MMTLSYQFYLSFFWVGDSYLLCILTSKWVLFMLFTGQNHPFPSRRRKRENVYKGVERVERPIVAIGWNDAQTMSKCTIIFSIELASK